MADALNGLGFVAERLRDWEAARRYFETGFKMGCEVEHKHAIAVSLDGLGMMAQQRLGWTEARRFFEQFLALENELDNAIQIAHALRRLGGIDFVGMCPIRRKFIHLSRTKLQAIHRDSAQQPDQRGSYQGDFEQASNLHVESLSLLQEKDVGFESNHAMLLNNMGFVAFRQDDSIRAKELFEESLLIY